MIYTTRPLMADLSTDTSPMAMTAHAGAKRTAEATHVDQYNTLETAYNLAVAAGNDITIFNGLYDVLDASYTKVYTVTFKMLYAAEVIKEARDVRDVAIQEAHTLFRLTITTLCIALQNPVNSSSTATRIIAAELEYIAACKRADVVYNKVCDEAMAASEL